MVARVVDIIHSYLKNGDYDRAVVASVGIVQLRINGIHGLLKVFYLRHPILSYTLSQIDEREPTM